MTLRSRLPKAVQPLGPILGPHGGVSKQSNKIREIQRPLADPARFELTTSAFGGQRFAAVDWATSMVGQGDLFAALPTPEQPPHQPGRRCKSFTGPQTRCWWTADIALRLRNVREAEPACPLTR